MADLKNMIEKLKGEITGPGVMSDREAAPAMGQDRGRFVPTLDQAFKMVEGPMSSMEEKIILKNFPSLMKGDNEPRMQERSFENQMFTIQNEIDNLTNEYDMNVRNQQYEQAQQIADVIDQLQQQKIAIQVKLGDQQMMSQQSNSGGIGAFADGGEAMAPQMSNEQGMAEIEMSKEQAMQEIFIPLAENGYEQEVMAILNNPIDSEISMQAQQVLAQVLSQDPEFDMEDFQMAVSLVAPQ